MRKFFTISILILCVCLNAQMVSTKTGYNNIITYTSFSDSVAEYKYTSANIGYCRDNKVLALKNGYLWLSYDYGVTFKKSLYAPYITEIKCSYIWDNGNVLICSLNEVFISNDNFSTIRKARVFFNGSEVDFSSYTDDCFKNQLSVEHIYINGKEYFIWGSYNNVLYPGHSPVCIFYSDGYSVKVAYAFGNNATYGNISLNPSNTVIARHVHSVSVMPDDSILVLTGDGTNECHLMKGGLNTITDTWTWRILYTSAGASSTDWYKWSVARYVNGYWYTALDIQYNDHRGLYKILYSDFGTPGNWVSLFHQGNQVGMDAFYEPNGVFIWSDFNDAADQYNILYYSKDFASTYNALLINPSVIGQKLFNQGAKLGNGWYKFTTCDGVTYNANGAIFIKFK